MTKNLWCGCTITMRSGCSVQQRNTVGMRFSGKRSCRKSFLRLLSRIPKLRTLKEGERAGYLAVTVRNTAFTLLRKQAKERGRCVSLETGALPVEGCLPEEWVIQRERWNTLAAVWPQLAPTERFLLEGRSFQQRSDRELSDDLGCGANQHTEMMTRARRHLCRRLMRREGEDQAAEQQK